jgi:hypothetical protein
MTRHVCRTAFLLLGLLCPIRLSAAERCTLSIQKTSVAPVIDGNLADDVWRTTQWSGDFVQQYPVPGDPPSARTRFAVAHDHSHFYLAVISETKDASLTTRMTRRDRDGDYDKIEILLTPRADRTFGYGFVVNPAGVQQDGVWSNDTVFDRSFDAIWEAETSIHEDHWILEVAIPLHQLRIQEGLEQWGIQVVRWQAHPTEQMVFCPRSPDDFGIVSRGGVLHGTARIPSRTPVTLTSELYLQGVHSDEAHSGTLPTGMLFGAGGGIRAGLTPQWTLNLAVLPDFGEMEIDRAVVNLTPIETLYEEKRPFFLEDAQLFRTPFRLFYSRRLGQPAPVPEVDGEKVRYGPASTPILSATRISGHGKRGSYVSLLHGLTRPVRYQMIHEETGVTTYRPSADWTHNAVLRTGRHVRSRHHVGALVTTALPQRNLGTVAHTGGLDADLLTTNRNWAFRGQVVGSAVAEPDAAYQTDLGLWTTFERIGGTRFRPSLRYTYRGPDLELNTLGYLDRNDLHDVESHLHYRQVEKRGPLLELYTGAKVHQQWNTRGLSLKQAGVLYLSSRWTSRIWTHVGGYGDLPYAADLEISDGPAVRRPAGGGGWLGFSTPDSNPIAFRFNSNLGTDHDGHYLVLAPQWTFRMDRFELSLAQRLTRSERRLSFVETQDDPAGEPTHIVGLRSLLELDTDLRTHAGAASRADPAMYGSTAQQRRSILAVY